MAMSEWPTDAHKTHLIEKLVCGSPEAEGFECDGDMPMAAPHLLQPAALC